MKKLRFVLVALLVNTTGLLAFNAHADKYYVGEITSQVILETFNKFKRHQDDVEYSAAQLAPLKAINAPVSVKIYFGQWCHDSQREVPRLIKLFSQLDNPNIDVSYYALNIKKSDPKGLAKQDNIRKTPTVIIYQNDAELARILEFPKVDWATDLSAILNR